MKSEMVRQKVLQLKRILWLLPVAILLLEKHIKLCRILSYFRTKRLIKVRTYGIYLFSYLSKQFTSREKVKILSHHYAFLKETFKTDVLTNLFSDGILCWDENNGENHFRIFLKASHILECEGSVTLLFLVNNNSVFNLYFSFAPGAIFGLENEKTVLFISGLKGVKNECSNIELVSKTYSDMSPRIILMKVLESMSICMGLRAVLAVNATNQVSFIYPDTNDSFYRNYDKFWESMRGEKLSLGYYAFHYPQLEKPMDEIKHRYKKRSMRRRIQSREIIRNSINYFSDLIKSPVCISIDLYTLP